MKISIIGAGRVGQALALRAREAGFEIVDIVCRSRRSANRAAKFIGAGKAQTASRARLADADLFLISTPDDKIHEAVELVRRSEVKSTVALHTSGALSSDVLKPLAENGFAVGSCHPLQSFESPERGVALLDKTYFCIEGNTKAVRVARRFVKAIGARDFEIKTEMKSLYHAAAVMSSGGITALLSVNLGLLMKCGLSEAKARQVLLPLVEGTLANIRAVGTTEALTGPVRRGDGGTVERNLKALVAADAKAMELYCLLAERSVALARAAGADEAALQNIRKLLGRK